MYAGRVGSRERERRLGLIGNEIRRHCVRDMDGHLRIKTSTAFPGLHVCAVSEFLCKVVDSILPVVEIHAAETTPRLDVLRL